MADEPIPQPEQLPQGQTPPKQDRKQASWPGYKEQKK